MNRREFTKIVGAAMGMSLGLPVGSFLNDTTKYHRGGIVKDSDRWREFPLTPASIGYSIPERSKVGDVITVTVGLGPDRKDLGKFRITNVVDVGGGMFKTTAEWCHKEMP
jgi:hypothetical protein